MPSQLLDGALERYRATPSGREKPSRYWKADLEHIEPPSSATPNGGTVRIVNRDPRILACDLTTAKRDHGALLERAFGKTPAQSMKFAYLTRAFEGLGAFVYVPADCASGDAILIRYVCAADEAIFPYTVVLLERGARATVVEELEAGPGAFVCATVELVTGESSDLTYASTQFAPGDAHAISTRAARPGRDASVTFASAEMGSALAVSDIVVAIDEPGASAHIAAVFFPGGTQHVDLVSTVEHRVGDSTSETMIKSAATGAGQGRYLGNIRIAADAQRTQANLRDDALLLSKRAHIDSIPALEIAANDVKAYHGATVGAIDEEAIFYMTSRGLDPASAERMIALGFFEPAIALFPSEDLRERLRVELEAKVASS